MRQKYKKKQTNLNITSNSSRLKFLSGLPSLFISVNLFSNISKKESSNAMHSSVCFGFLINFEVILRLLRAQSSLCKESHPKFMIILKIVFYFITGEGYTISISKEIYVSFRDFHFITMTYKNPVIYPRKHFVLSA